MTHAHADHARSGSASYLAHRDSAGVLRKRLGAALALQTVDYGETLVHRGVRISLHPAGHVLGSAQIRVEQGGEVWVVSGDYKLQADGTCAPFESVPCHTFVSESTFGLPIYRWPETGAVIEDIHRWWTQNAAQGRCSLLYAYAFGKAQRVLHELKKLLPDAAAGLGPIVCHGAVEALNECYRQAGVALPETMRVSEISERAQGAAAKDALRRALVIAPPSAAGTPWLRRFGVLRDAFASGWMQVRGARRRRGVDRGFVISDHADWPGLLAAIAGSGAPRVLVTHGHVAPLVRWLREQGLAAEGLVTEYGGEDEPASEKAAEPPAQGGGDSP